MNVLGEGGKRGFGSLHFARRISLPFLGEELYVYVVFENHFMGI